MNEVTIKNYPLAEIFAFIKEAFAASQQPKLNHDQ